MFNLSKKIFTSAFKEWLKDALKCKYGYKYEYYEYTNMIKNITPNDDIYEWKYKYDKNGMLIEIIENNKSILKIK